jgi:predicted O-methyltransferase YrrM
MAVAYRRSQILVTAHALGVFDALAARSLTAARLARVLGTDSHATTVFLEAVAGLGLLRRSHEMYSLTPESRRFLVSTSPEYQGDLIGLHANLYTTWGRLTEVVRHGCPAWALPSPDADEKATVSAALHGAASSHAPAPASDEAETEMRTFILAMHDIARARVPAVLGVLSLRGVRHILDLGGGPGTYAVAFALASPTLRVTLFDRPLPTEIARGFIEDARVGDRVTTLAGDFLIDGIGGGYDAAFVSNILHGLGVDEATNLLRKVHDALVPGGQLIVQEFLVNNDRKGPPHALLFAVNMLLNTREGTAYSFRELEALMRRAGFTGARRRNVDDATSLVFARRR